VAGTAGLFPPEALRGAPRIGLGLAALGRPAYITAGRDSELGADRSRATLRRRTLAVLDAAYEAGVRYFDVARSYGCAESFLGEWLSDRGLGHADVAVGSKWGYTYVGGWRLDAERHEVQDLSVEALRRQLGETRERLGAHLSLYQIHSATLENGVLSSATVLDAMRELRDEHGVAIGVTVTGARQAAAIDEVIRLDQFDAIQATWNLLEPSSADALARAHSAGLTVIVKEALANGRLTTGGDQAALVEAAAQRGLAPDTLALSAALAQPWAGIVLSGAVTTDDLHSNLAASPRHWDADLARELESRLARAPAIYWDERSRRPWA
jgi:aryl-alcohol dehydrogenase-like predicted oxidoreductase